MVDLRGRRQPMSGPRFKEAVEAAVTAEEMQKSSACPIFIEGSLTYKDQERPQPSEASIYFHHQ